MATEPQQSPQGSKATTRPHIPEHELLRQIGEGAYGEVWLARSVTGAYRAVKIVYRQRFTDDRPYEREFKGITKFEPLSRSNDGLVDVLQVGREDAAGFFYYVMELADDARINPNDESRNPKEFRNRISEEFPGKAAVGPSGFAPGSEFGIWNSEFYVPKTLALEVRTCGRLPFQECVQLGLSVSLGLGHLHRHGLLHRD